MTQQTSTPEQIRETLDWTVDPYSSACGCMGPQRDEPLCPCAMRNVIRWRGRWVQMSVVGNDAPADDFLSGLTPKNKVGYLTSVSAVLVDVGPKKVHVIGEIRKITGLSLTDAKSLVDRVMSIGAGVAIMSDISRDEAECIEAKIAAVGGTVEIR